MVEDLLLKGDATAPGGGAYDLLGQIYLKAGDINSARDSFEKHLEVYPDSEGTYVYLGLIEEIAGAPAKAAEWFSKCPSREFDRSCKGAIRTAREQWERTHPSAVSRMRLLADRIKPPSLGGKSDTAPPRRKGWQLWNEVTLIRAASRSDLATVRRMLAAGADVNASHGLLALFGAGPCALDSAALKGHAEVVEVLLQAGAKTERSGPIVAAPLFNASGRGHTAIVKALLKAGANPNVAASVFSQSNVTPLHNATRLQDSEMVGALLDAGANPNAEGSVSSQDGITPLHNATDAAQKPEVVRLLIEAGANVNAAIRARKASTMQDHGRITPLYNCSVNGNAEMAKLLLDAGASVNVHCQLQGITPLMNAAYYGHEEIVRLFLDFGADPNAKSEGRRLTPLMYAAMGGQAAIAKMLLDAGADPKCKSMFGSTAAACAKKEGHTECFELLRRVAE